MTYRLKYQEKTLKGEIKLSGSKSESNRALIINYLSGNNLGIQNLSTSDDTQTLANLLSSIDTQVEFNVGHAGTAMRFLTALFAITPGERILKGSDRMHERPIRILVEALKSLGAKIEYLKKEGYPPLKISGQPLYGGVISVCGDVSSQYLSALMMIAPYLNGGLKININGDLVSRPYVEMTAAIMSYFGARLVAADNQIFIENWKYITRTYNVEADWSSSSYWYEAASFCDEVDLNIEGLKFSGSLQADAVLKDIYTSFGIKTTAIKNGIKLTKIDINKPFKEYNFESCPDIAQTLSCTAILLHNDVLLTGLKTLKIKETDRIEALKSELNKIGVFSQATQDSLLVFADKTLKSACISTYNDHRMAMAFAMLVFHLGEIDVENPEVVSKSYPEFWNHLQEVGVAIKKK